MLRDLDLKSHYRSGQDALLDDFYVPCLEESISYDRAVGFFSSTLLHVVAIAYSDFVRRGGHMRLVCSPALTEDDFDAMKAGADLGSKMQQRLREELEELLVNPAALSATRLLATLIGAEVMEVKVASLGGTPGIFHDKLGVFTDEEGRRVSFVGSANETWAAWGLNHESFEVFRSWEGETDLLRTRRHAEEFERLWLGLEKGVRVESLDQITADRLVEVALDDMDEALAAARGRAFPEHIGRELLPHQIAVLQSWRSAGRRGIVAFATGAGKTLTALAAAREWCAEGKPVLILVPGQELHAQWTVEIATEFPDVVPLKCGAGAPGSSWHELLPIYSGSDGPADEARIILTTNATFASERFRALLRDGEHLMVVGDEVHRLGSTRSLAALAATEAGATLGLSATYRRQFDERGTENLVSWFGPVLEPVVGIAEAILLGLLVPYDYRLHTLTLSDEELTRYAQLTDRIRRSCAIEGMNDGVSDFLQMLLIQRARILKKASGKVDAAVEILRREYEDGQRWLVYCDDKEQLGQLVQAALQEDLPIAEFHSGMAGDRHATLRSLAEFGGVVAAIRCLDEGVDIPACDQALILASSTSAREYIQRRGRVLRSAPGKVSASVHDLLLVDVGGGVLARSEAIRALEFARLARNPASRARLQYLIAMSPDVELPDEMSAIFEDVENTESGEQ